MHDTVAPRRAARNGGRRNNALRYAAGVNVVSAVIPRDPQTCWRAFTDVANLVAWVPGLQRAETIAMALGMPGEVHFEYAGSRIYTLVYTYDVIGREVRWQAKLGRRDGVAGFARFDEDAGGTRMTYGLEQGESRSDAEREAGDPQVLADAFASWIVTARV
jgi:uncharacterized protein YndB with AHSA1/START domain